MTSDLELVERGEAKFSQAQALLTKPESLENGGACVQNKSMTLTWRNLVVNAPSLSGDSLLSRLRFSRKSSTSQTHSAEKGSFSSSAGTFSPPKKVIINHVDGIAKPREILAIMGASGAGKTTMLNVLNFRNRGKLKIEGQVCVNGQLINSIDEISSISGYVQQDDLFIGACTVKENLIFQAMLRMDKRFNTKERYERVEKVMQDLNLTKCENVPIGLEGQKGISGGEKRRLGFASEILTDPSILFCDEPTSGLDSFMALSVVESMRNLAKQGKTIICTIHQPSSEIFELFDKLCLLAEGRLAFLGSLEQASSFFETQGYRVPYNYNPADFYIKNLAILPWDRENSAKKINLLCDGFEKSEIRKEIVERIDELHCGHTTLSQEIVNFDKEQEYRASFVTQMRWLLWRNLISQIRDPNSLRIQLVQTILIPILYGLIYFQLKLNQKGVQNISGILFLCMANNSFANMFVVINTFTAEVPIFFREHQNRVYKVLSYYLSKVILDIPGFTILPVIFVTICYWMANLNNAPDRFFICCGINILVAHAAVAFGGFLSACAPNTNVALALSGPVLVPQMIFAGFLLNLEDVPVYFLILRYVSWFGYASENLLINEFLNVTNVDCDDMTQKDCLKRFSNGEEILDFFKVDPSRFYYNLACIFIIILGWRLMTFLVLVIKSRKR